MEVIYSVLNNYSELDHIINDFENELKFQSALLFIVDNESITSSNLSQYLIKTSKPIIGGVFPEIIYKGERKTEGALLIKLDFKLHTKVIDLSNSSDNIDEELKALRADYVDSFNSLFVFADALNPKKDLFIDLLFNHFGISPTYIGGGAGSLSFKPIPSIIGNSKLNENAAVIGWTDKKIALGVAHGYQSISEPLKVTKAVGNKIESINWKPAFTVYKTIVEKHSGMEFNADNFFDIAKSYPLGISKIDAEMVVRDPYMVEGNCLLAVDVVKEGEYVNILHGNINSLLQGAENARNIAFSKFDTGMNNDMVFCIDCISRVLFMQNEFEKELEIIGQNRNVNGVLSIGEIANSEESYLEIYNKTVVVGVW